MQMELMIVSPDLAEQWLNANGLNRPVKSNHVDYFIKLIELGEYVQEHPQPICLYENGGVGDGQHRLRAIVKTGKPQLCWVARNVPMSAMVSVDSGVSRSILDRLVFSGDYADRKIVQVSRAYFNVKRASTIKPTLGEIRSVMQQFSKALENMRPFVTQNIGIGRCAVWAAWLEMFEIDEHAAIEFAHSFISPDGQINQANMLRNYVLTSCGTGGGGKKQLETFAKSIYCMNAYLDGKIIYRVLRGEWTHKPCNRGSETT